MANGPKILLLDDEQELLDLYRDILRQLPSQPEVHTSNSGARAIALLESEPFTLLISDLRMPKMDGLQVLSIVRRKFPQLRLMVMTGLVDEQYRSRAYAIGIDLFWEKPKTPEEINLLRDCVESLLGQVDEGGFRGVQSKNLIDLIQLECLSHSSSILKISHAGHQGNIWVENGEIIDASTLTLGGEEAFKEILSWKNGSFEILPADTGHPRVIQTPYQGLLLDYAQAFDENKTSVSPLQTAECDTTFLTRSPLAALSKVDGVEFVMTVPADEKAPIDSWGLENASPVSAWTRQTQKRLRELGEKLHAGDLKQVEGMGFERHVGIASRGDTELCVGFRRNLSSEQLYETLKNISIKWAS
ncbi:MAG: response regulator [Verrucomicrobiota bacterium]